MATQPSLSQQMAQLITLTLEVLKAAKAGDWEQVEQQEQNRQQQLRQTLGGDLPEQQAKQIASAINRIKKIEKDILALAEAAKSDTGKELRQLHKGNKAIKGYQQN